MKLADIKRPFIIILMIILYFVTAVPVGMLIYALKNSWGYDTFSKSGYHAVSACFKQEYSKYKTLE